MQKNTTLLALLAGTLAFAVAGCDDKGPVEQAGEEIDEAVDTVRSGGESTASKIDDAVDEIREGAQDAVEEVKN